VQPLIPFVRWVGGKRWLASRLVEEIAASGATLYVEPFLGGGAVALAVPMTKQVLADTNRALVNTWRMLAAYPQATAEAAQIMLAQYAAGRHVDGRDAYEAVRYDFNSRPPFGINAAAQFLYLNATCFNGLWRTNATGYFNVPHGDVANPNVIDVAEAVALAERLGDADIHHDDFRVTVGIAGEGAAVFADPPYDAGFTNYEAAGFAVEHQRALAEELRAACKRGARVWATNADTPLVRELYAWAKLEEVVEPRRVAAAADAPKGAPCLLIRG
jgi:DNA adenine methylase